VGALRQQQIDAAREFARETISRLAVDRKVHAETAIAGVARMAGTFLFRSFGFTLPDLQPGQAVLSDKANEQGPRLVQVLETVLANLKVTIDKGKLGGAPSPANQPLQSFLETQRVLEPVFREISNRHGLSAEEAADTSAIATAILIQQCKAVLDPTVAFGVAVQGFVEGTKTAPDPVAL
jgi:hypothetical protein